MFIHLLLFDPLVSIQIREGKGEAMLTKEQINKTFPEINQLVGSSLYVKVTVLSDKGKDLPKYSYTYMNK